MSRKAKKQAKRKAKAAELAAWRAPVVSLADSRAKRDKATEAELERKVIERWTGPRDA